MSFNIWKTTFNFWRKIWISILVTLLQLYRRKEKLKICRYDCTYVTWYMFLRYLRKEEMSVRLLTLDNLTWNVLTAHRRGWLTILLNFYCLCVPVIWSFLLRNLLLIEMIIWNGILLRAVFSWLIYVSVNSSKFIQEFAQKCQYFTLIAQSVPLYTC